MSDLVEVRMVTQMSGPRGDGTDWPPVGGTLEVSEAEAAVLCHNPDPLNPPIAVRVDKPKPVEAAIAPGKDVEERPGATEAATERAVAPDIPVKRGPGRPPGSPNKPKVP